MAQVTVYIRGTFKWCKLVDPDKKFKVWTLDIYPDAPSWDLFHQTGLELKERTDAEGNLFLKVRRPVEKLVKGEVVQFAAPEVLRKTEDGVEPLPHLVGNGSKGVVKVVVYDTPKGRGHRLESVLVEELVEYVAGEVLADEDYPF